MGRDAKDKYKYDVAFTYAKNKLTEFRTEERRKVKYCELALVKLIDTFCAGNWFKSL